MGIEDGFTIEVGVSAPRDVALRALTEPAEIARWFGWDYEGIEAEIRQIFVDDAKPAESGDIDLGWGQTVTVEAGGPEDRPITLVRITKPGPRAGAAQEDEYDEIIRGWHGFFLQLRHYLDRHPGEDRRTLFLDGTASPVGVLAALDRAVPGTDWLRIRHQRVTAVEAFGGGLVAVLSEQPLDATGTGKVQVTITTHGLDDDQFAVLHQQWAMWWRTLSDMGTVTPAAP